jgi:hypothetical protein
LRHFSAPTTRISLHRTLSRSAWNVQISRGPPGRRPDLHHLRQPGLQQNSGDPGVGSPAQGRAVSDTDQRLVGQPDRGTVRSVAAVHDGQLRTPQPPRACAGVARVSAVAQRQQPESGCAGRAASRTCPGTA